MLVGARLGAWSGGAKMPTARDYVQDGLIAMWDGIENNGFGDHSENITKWIDLSGNKRHINLVVSNLIVGDKYVQQIDPIASLGAIPVVSQQYLTIEVVASTFSGMIAKLRYEYKGPIFNGIHNDYNGGSSWYYGSSELKRSEDGWAYGSVTAGTSRDVSTNCLIANGVVIPDSKVATGNIALSILYLTGSSLGGYRKEAPYSGKIGHIRIYNRRLSVEERLSNYAVDKARFGLT